jgi:TatD DNase family protein
LRLYDAHNHLQDERFRSAFAAQRESGTRGGASAADRLASADGPVSCDDLVAQAARSGVARMVVNGSCEEDWPAVLELAQQYPQVLPSFGYHPWYLGERTAEWQRALVRFLDRVPSAVGEIGLDRWKPDLPYEGQEDAFTWQLRLAAERNLPASIHCLQAWGRLHELLRDTARPERGFLLHSYGASKEMIEPLAKLGAYFSFPGYFMHERKARQCETFQHVPLDRLLIETDAPDQLLPASDNLFPLNDSAGQPLNHPANLVRIYEFMARARQMPLETFATQIEENFACLFWK